MSSETVDVVETQTWDGRVTARVRVSGPEQAPPVLFLHGPAGLVWDEFLDALAERYRVYAPEHPGTSPGHADAIRELEELWDLVLHYFDVLDELGVGNPLVVGHSFGAMVAAELAATCPDRVRALALISPLGLWDEREPVAHYQMMTRDELEEAMAGASGRLPQQAAPSGDKEALDDELIRWTWAMGCTSKFAWPIPERGLHKRLHRIACPTLILTGDGDRILPSSYAARFSDGIRRAESVVVAGAGHALQLERPAEAAAAIDGFFGGLGD